MRIYPFFAVRAPAHRASEVSCPPYDVVDRAEAEAFAARPNNFMRVVRSDVDFPPDHDPHRDEVYERARENFNGLIQQGMLRRDEAAQMFVYRTSRGGRRQAGLVCCVDVDDYRSGDIRRHELTRPDKELDRVRHMLTVGAHCEPVMLAVMQQTEFSRQLSRDMNFRPLLHISTKDGVTHTLWMVQECEPYARIFADVDRMYIADGHHRCAAAERVAEQLGGEARRFPAVVFQGEDLLILPYHRLARLAPGRSIEDVERALAAMGSLEPVPESVGPAPTSRGEVGIFLGQTWWRFRLPAPSGSDPLAQLDVVRLSRTVLQPIFGITDERTDPRISFLGGCSTEELARKAIDSKFDAAFAMFPTSMEDLVSIAGANFIMPPKSTWFDPKIRSGLFVHSFESSNGGGLPSSP